MEPRVRFDDKMTSLIMILSILSFLFPEKIASNVCTAICLDDGFSLVATNHFDVIYDSFK